MKTRINKQRLKDSVLFFYVVFTLMAAYSAAIFYEGYQFAHGQSEPTVSVHVTHPSKK